jgi:3-deoxy-7-phosphoheptulonate synthase
MKCSVDFKLAKAQTIVDFPAQKPVKSPYPLASRHAVPQGSVVSLGQAKIGAGELFIIAGPCSVDDRNLVLETALAVKEAGAQALRGGAFKPRTSPYSFQGLGAKGLELLAEARQLTGLPVVTEVMAIDQVPLVMQYSDMFQIGSRNMQNFPLLHAVGETRHPVLLKRGFSATLEELLLAAEYILAPRSSLPSEEWNVALCERGIRTFESTTRNTTDINAIPALKSLSHLPVLLDPSHSTGDSRYVIAIARAGVAAGADGLLVEVHADPDRALTDAQQTLRPEQFAALVRQVRRIAQVIQEEN